MPDKKYTETYYVYGKVGDIVDVGLCWGVEGKGKVVLYNNKISRVIELGNFFFFQEWKDNIWKDTGMANKNCLRLIDGLQTL